jgi:hypothetical protein
VIQLKIHVIMAIASQLGNDSLACQPAAAFCARFGIFFNFEKGITPPCSLMPSI